VRRRRLLDPPCRRAAFDARDRLAAADERRHVARDEPLDEVAGRCPPRGRRQRRRYTRRPMGDWYTIGILVGLGTALGIAATAVLRRAPVALVVAAVLAAAIGLAFWQWDEAVGGIVGAICGSLGSAPLVSGTLRRGGTRGGTAALLGLASLVVAALAFVPVVGYLEAIAVPVLGLRLRRRSPDRHAGLRSLAKD